MSRAMRVSPSPNLVLSVVCLALAGLLTLRMTLPVGPFYWDLFVYFDAANRILDGQVPAVDFFTPVGPIGYWLFTALVKLFPVGQPLLVVQWSTLIVSAPLFALVLREVDRRSRPTAFALLVPFLIFSVLPFNVEQYSIYPGVDGFGIYNRQTCHLLYVLASALVFCRGPRTLLTVVAGTMLALFLMKITGLVAGLMLCLFAFAAGRIPFRVALGAALAFFAVLAGLQLGLGMLAAYLRDIFLLLGKNESSLLPRFLQTGSIHFNVCLPLAALIAALLVLDRRAIAADARGIAGKPALARIAAFLDRDVLWIGVAGFAGLFFETQNTGGQAFIFVWPMLLAVLLRTDLYKGAARLVVFSLIAATAFPTMLDVVHRAARALVGQVQYQNLESKNLKTLGAVSQRPEMLFRAEITREAYHRFPETWEFFASKHQLPSFTLYAEPDFQATWLMATDEAVSAIKDYEAANGVRFETIMSLNFVNPFPWLLDRQAPHAIAIGADPFRAVPDPDASVLTAVRQADLILYPKCPVTHANQLLHDIYRSGMPGHRLVALSPCWDAYVRSSLVPLE